MAVMKLEKTLLETRHSLSELEVKNALQRHLPTHISLYRHCTEGKRKTFSHLVVRESKNSEVLYSPEHANVSNIDIFQGPTAKGVAYQPKLISET